MRVRVSSVSALSSTMRMLGWAGTNNLFSCAFRDQFAGSAQRAGMSGERPGLRLGLPLDTIRYQSQSLREAGRGSPLLGWTAVACGGARGPLFASFFAAPFWRAQAGFRLF